MTDATPIKKPSCKTCRFYLAHKDGDHEHGDCRRWPPAFVLVHDAEIGRLTDVCLTPFVDADEWCGEYQTQNH